MMPLIVVLLVVMFRLVACHASVTCLRERGEQVADGVAHLQQAGEEPAPAHRQLLHGERGAKPHSPPMLIP